MTRWVLFFAVLLACVAGLVAVGQSAPNLNLFGINCKYAGPDVAITYTDGVMNSWTCPVVALADPTGDTYGQGCTVNPAVETSSFYATVNACIEAEANNYVNATAIKNLVNAGPVGYSATTTPLPNGTATRAANVLSRGINWTEGYCATYGNGWTMNGLKTFIEASTVRNPSRYSGCGCTLTADDVTYLQSTVTYLMAGEGVATLAEYCVQERVRLGLN